MQVSRTFSAERALDQLEDLSDFGPRSFGSRAAKRARRFIRDRLEDFGIATTEYKLELALPDGRSVPSVHLLGRIPGRAASDVFLLAAPYVGSWVLDDEAACARASHHGSGVALLLELARAIAKHPLPYDAWVAFVDEGPEASELDAVPAGSLSLARSLDESGDLERVRLAVFLDRVGEPNLRVARDLHSHRTFRERFFEVAQRLGYTETFPRDAGFETAWTGHRSFLQAGHRQVVAVVGSASEAPAASPAQNVSCSARSLEAVGQVNLLALDELAAVLQRLDALVGAGRAPRPADEG
jgi:hypothetical protein